MATKYRTERIQVTDLEVTGTATGIVPDTVWIPGQLSGGTNNVGFKDFGTGGSISFPYYATDNSNDYTIMSPWGLDDRYSGRTVSSLEVWSIAKNDDSSSGSETVTTELRLMQHDGTVGTSVVSHIWATQLSYTWQYIESTQQGAMNITSFTSGDVVSNFDPTRLNVLVFYPRIEAETAILGARVTFT